jgi:hypothetical protein
MPSLKIIPENNRKIRKKRIFKRSGTVRFFFFVMMHRLIVDIRFQK